MLWLVCIARDRYRAYRKARRIANRGAIVISDRYPHPALRLMDMPQIARLTARRPRNRFINGLIEREERYHRRIAPPDVALVLKVDPEEAARRKTDEAYDHVMERSAEVWELDWSDFSVHVIDASHPPEVVAAELKDLIWQALA